MFKLSLVRLLFEQKLNTYLVSVKHLCVSVQSVCRSVSVLSYLSSMPYIVSEQQCITRRSRCKRNSRYRFWVISARFWKLINTRITNTYYEQEHDEPPILSKLNLCTIVELNSDGCFLVRMGLKSEKWTILFRFFFGFNENEIHSERYL